MTLTDPLVQEVLPDLAAALRSGLEAEGEPALASQVDELRITALCRCHADFCGGFYTGPPPAGAWGPSARMVMLDNVAVNVDVVDERIGYVEVLGWGAVRQARGT
jgi:hypothetical protein